MVRSTIQRAVDLLLLSALVALVAYPLTGNAVHEVLGLGMAALLLGHTFLNLSWYRRRWWGNIATRLDACINLALLACLGTLLASGVLISHTLFPRSDGAEAWTVRGIHVAAGCWFLVLSSLHLGRHGRRALPAPVRSIGKGRRAAGAVRFAAFAVVVLGLTEFVTGSLVPRMFLQGLFGEFVPGEACGRVLSRHMAVIGAFAVLGHLGVGRLRRSRGRKAEGDCCSGRAAVMNYGTRRNA
jgi:hypothetical protein